MTGENLIKTLLIWLLSKVAWGAACCGNGGNFPALITGDVQFQNSLYVSLQNRFADSSDDGSYSTRPSENQEVIRTFALRSSYSLSPFFQLGFEVPVTYRSTTSEKHTGPGDVSFQAAYEILPEVEFSYWKPRAFTYIQFGLPTGGSRFDSSRPLQLDANGVGFFNLNLGILVLKEWGIFDFSLSPKITYFFSRSFLGRNHNPSFGGSAQLGVGIQPFNSVRIGTSVLYTKSPSVEIEGFQNPTLSSEQIALVTSLSFSFSDWNLNLSYSDSGWFSGNRNAPLSQVVGLQLTHFVLY